MATKTRGLENPSFCWLGGDGRDSEPEPELMLLVDDDLDSGPRMSSLSWVRVPPDSQSSYPLLCLPDTDEDEGCGLSPTPAEVRMSWRKAFVSRSKSLENSERRDE